MIVGSIGEAGSTPAGINSSTVAKLGEAVQLLRGDEGCIGGSVMGDSLGDLARGENGGRDESSRVESICSGGQHAPSCCCTVVALGRFGVFSSSVVHHVSLLMSFKRVGGALLGARWCDAIHGCSQLCLRPRPPTGLGDDRLDAALTCSGGRGTGGAALRSCSLGRCSRLWLPCGPARWRRCQSEV